MQDIRRSLKWQHYFASNGTLGLNLNSISQLGWSRPRRCQSHGLIVRICHITSGRKCGAKIPTRALWALYGAAYTCMPGQVQAVLPGKRWSGHSSPLAISLSRSSAARPAGSSIFTRKFSDWCRRAKYFTRRCLSALFASKCLRARRIRP